MKKGVIILVALVVLLSLYLFGTTELVFRFPFSDGAIGIYGNVYEIYDRPRAGSMIYMYESNDIEESKAFLASLVPDSSKGSPLTNAVVEVGKKEDVLRDGLYQYKVNTADDGSFKKGWLTLPKGEGFYIKISSPGYEEAGGYFFNGGSTTRHGIIARLVKKQ